MEIKVKIQLSEEIDYQKVKDVIRNEKNDFIHIEGIENYYTNFCKKYDYPNSPDVFYKIMIKRVLMNQKN